MKLRRRWGEPFRAIFVDIEGLERIQAEEAGHGSWLAVSTERARIELLPEAVAKLTCHGNGAVWTPGDER